MNALKYATQSASPDLPFLTHRVSVDLLGSLETGFCELNWNNCITRSGCSLVLRKLVYEEDSCTVFDEPALLVLVLTVSHTY